MPVFDCRQFIEESVSSILTQTYSDFELIIIDDCSTDGTREYLESLNDSRIILVKKTENSGYTISLNMGLDMARGEYIVRMDGDDVSLPERFAKQLAFMDANQEICLSGTGYQVIDSSTRFIPRITHKQILIAMLETCPFAHPTVIFRRSVIKKNNLKYDHFYEPAEDYKMWINLSQYGEVANLEESLLLYRVHPAQTTVTRAIKQQEVFNLIRQEWIIEICKCDKSFKGKLVSIIEKSTDLNTYFENEISLEIGLKSKGIVLTENYYIARLDRILESSLCMKSFPLAFILKLLPIIFKFKKRLHLKFFTKYLIKLVIRS